MRSLAVLACSLVLSCVSFADTIDVPLGGDIQAAIDGASDGDIIQIAAGTFAIKTTIDPGGKPVTIRGAVNEDDEPTTIQRQSNSATQQQDSNCTRWPGERGSGCPDRMKRWAYCRGGRTARRRGDRGPEIEAQTDT